jgi:hypothetical protein
MQISKRLHFGLVFFYLIISVQPVLAQNGIMQVILDNTASMSGYCAGAPDYEGVESAGVPLHRLLESLVNYGRINGYRVEDEPLFSNGQPLANGSLARLKEMAAIGQPCPSVSARTSVLKNLINRRKRDADLRRDG